jgi:hypothetical protein
MNLTSALLPLLSYGEELFADSEAVFNSLAHGEGGLAKIEAAAKTLAKLLSDAAVAAIGIGAPQTAVNAINAAGAAAVAVGAVINPPATVASWSPPAV